MLKFYVDYNSCEEFDVIILPLDARLNRSVSEADMTPGARVLLYDEETECEAILRHGQHYKWVAELLRDTIKHLPEEQWNRFEEK